MALSETDLYPPVKAFLEGQGYKVKSEIRHCDVVAQRGEEPLVIVELKLVLNLEVILQGVDRQKLSEHVYLAVFDKKRSLWRRQRKRVERLLRLLGLGLLLVTEAKDGSLQVNAALDPAPYQPRKSMSKQSRLLKEFSELVGDPNQGGMQGRRVTVYRQNALKLRQELAVSPDLSPGELARRTGVEKAASILQNNHYGWFERVSRGIYRLSPLGEETWRSSEAGE